MSDFTLDEIWLSIPGYRGLYEASDQGRIRSLPHETRTGWRGGTILKPRPNPGGYLKVGLYKDNHCRTKNVATLVLLTFAGPRPAGKEARHLDGIQTNDHLYNLVWGTKSENTLDQVRHGTHWEARVHACPRCSSELTLRPNGHRYCAPCSRAQNRRWMEEHKEYRREYDRQRRAG